MALRLIRDGAHSGAWNMAVDESLLESARGGEAILRLYQWDPPTLSLGYFQPAEQRRAHRESRDLALVRRSTGGGAIVHDRELTYSYAAPASGARGNTESLYWIFHESLVEALNSLWPAVAWTLHEPPQPADVGGESPGGESPRGESPRGESPGGESPDPPFLCFERRAAGDVLGQGHKVCGSAQRRARGAVLQHGSILLQTSPAATQLRGIAELCCQAVSSAQVLDRWLPILTRRLGVSALLSRLREEERLRAEDLAVGRFTADDWNARR